MTEPGIGWTDRNVCPTGERGIAEYLKNYLGTKSGFSRTDILVCPLCAGSAIISAEPRMPRREALPPEKLQITRRHLPHWTMTGATYFITFRVASGCLNSSEVVLVRDHIRSGDPSYYELPAAVVLPDHAHLLLRPQAETPVTRIMKGIKGVTARLINRQRGERGSIWQDESFDRIVRDREEFREKLRYMILNPVRAGLTRDPWSYPGLFIKQES